MDKKKKNVIHTYIGVLFRDKRIVKPQKYMEKSQMLLLSKKKPIWLVFRGTRWMWAKGSNFYL